VHRESHGEANKIDMGGVGAECATCASAEFSASRRNCHHRRLASRQCQGEGNCLYGLCPRRSEASSYGGGSRRVSCQTIHDESVACDPQNDLALGGRGNLKIILLLRDAQFGQPLFNVGADRLRMILLKVMSTWHKMGDAAVP
jgi:hypothetical protein